MPSSDQLPALIRKIEDQNCIIVDIMADIQRETNDIKQSKKYALAKIRKDKGNRELPLEDMYEEDSEMTIHEGDDERATN